MKVRNGFVSNSSSASFIIHWRIKGFGDKVNKEEALRKLFDIGSYNEYGEMQKINWENEWHTELKSKFEQIEESTVDNNDNTFTTTFVTSMMNSAEDFGEAAKSLVIALVVNDKEIFSIVDVKIEGEN